MTIISEIMKLTPRIEPISGQKFSYVKLDDVLAILEAEARVDHAPAGNTPARLSDGTIDNMLSKLDQGAAYQGYAEGFGFSWTQLAGDAATVIRRLRQQVASPVRSAASTAEAVAWQYRYNAGRAWSEWVNLTQEAYTTLNQSVEIPFEKRALYAAPTTSPEPSRTTAITDALRPFADLAARLSDKHRDSRPLFFALDQPTEITVGDIRRAAAALSSAPVAGESTFDGRMLHEQYDGNGRPRVGGPSDPRNHREGVQS